MSEPVNLNWEAISADPRFRRLHRRKSAVLLGLMSFSILYYFLLPFGAAYFQEFFRIRLFGSLNLGLVFALSEFVAAWGVAWYYSRRANAEFDAMARGLLIEAERIGVRG